VSGLVGRLRSGYGRRGQAMVEFALVIPILILVMMGVFDFGRAIYASSAINNAAREGARLAIVDQTLTHIQDRASQQAVALGIAPTDVDVEYRLGDQLENENSCDTHVGTDEIYGCLAVVKVPYSFTAVTPILGHIVGTINMVGEARFPISYSCVDPPPDPPNDCPVGD
jgi:TadE-like protein